MTKLFDEEAMIKQYIAAENYRIQEEYFYSYIETVSELVSSKEQLLSLVSETNFTIPVETFLKKHPELKPEYWD